MKNLITINLIFFSLALFGQNWEQLGSDIDGELANDQSGRAVSISGDGNRVAIGAPFNDSAGANAGQVRVYEYDGANWVQLGVDIDGDAVDDESGTSVSLSLDGSRVAIGSPNNDVNGSNSGTTKVYEFNGSSWVQLGANINGEAADDLSGFAVALSSDGARVIIGAYGNDGNGASAGHARVYEYNGSSWVQLGADIDGEAIADLSGAAVSISSDGSRVAIGAYGNDGTAASAGHVRIYEYNGSSWIQLGGDIDGDSGNDESGRSVSLSADGSRVVIGSPYNDDFANESGHVRIFEYNGSSWIKLGSNIEAEGIGDLSGSSVDISANGDKVVIGSPNADGVAGNSGQIRVFEYDGSNWAQTGSSISGEAGADLFGRVSAISDDGNRVVGGANVNDGNGTNSGHAMAFRYLSIEYNSLMAIYNNTDGANWTNNTGWGTDPDLNNWFGVTADGSGNVSALSLSNNNLNGSLPQEIGNLTSLTSLEIENNLSLTGAIPDEIGNLVNLTFLRLPGNGFTGSIPTTISNLTGLTNLYLMSNNLTGDIPEFGDMTNMNIMELHSNDFTGSVGNQWGSMTSMTFLTLHSNSSLSGEVPSYFYDGTFTLMDYFDIGGTNICEPTATEYTDWTATLSTYNGTGNSCANPIAYYQFNGDATDASGNAYDGTALNGTYVEDRFGNANSALSLDGSLSSYVSLVGGTGVSISGDFTYSAWVNLNSITGRNSMIYSADQYVDFRIEDGTPSAEDYDNVSLFLAASGISAGEWKLLTLTQSGGILTFYIDDTAAGTSATAFTDGDVTTPQRIGFDDDAGFDGVIDDVRFFNYALTTDDVAALYNENAYPDYQALVALFNSTTGGSWTNSSGWASPADLSTWHGVTVDGNGRVTELFLESNNLNGPLPAEIGNMEFLETISLYDNNLTGSIPPEMGNLSNLRTINFNSTSLTGDIPTELGLASSLEQLSLNSNGLTGAIPTELTNLTNLFSLDLSGNELTGSIPVEIGNLTGLSSLYLHNNDFTGNIPAELGSLTNISILYLGGNNGLTGDLPTEFWNLTNMLYFYIWDTELSGNLPAEFGNWTNLVEFQFSNSRLSGDLPAEIINLTSLTNFWISGNQFTGAIPSEFSTFTNLAHFSISANDFVTLPDFSGASWAGTIGTFAIEGNRFSFDDIVPNLSVANISYNPQNPVDDFITAAVLPGDSYDMTVNESDPNTSFQWRKDGADISGATSSSYSIASFGISDGGTYTCVMTNSTEGLGMEIQRRDIFLSVDFSTMGIVGTALASPSNTTEHFLSNTGLNTYRGVVYLTDGSFNFRANSDDGFLWGDDGADGVAGLGEGAISVTEGLYDIRLNIETGDYSLGTFSNVGFIGSARTGDNTGWWTDVNMNEVGIGRYEIPFIQLFDGEWKIRVDGDWANVNWGSINDDGTLDIMSSDNVAFNGGNGFYSVFVDIINETYSIGPAHDLLGQYTFNGDVLDTSGNGNNGTLTTGTESYSLDRFDNTSSTLLLDGSTYYTTALVPTPSADFSASLWFNWDGPVDGTNFQEMLGWHAGVTNNSYVGIDEGLGNIIRFGDYMANTGVAAPQGTWTHLVVVYDNTNTEGIVYLNGGEVARATIASPPVFTNMVIGALGPSGGEFFRGELDDVLVFQKALNPQEINALYGQNNYANTRITDVNVPGVSFYNFWITNYLNAVTIMVPSDADLSTLAPEFTVAPNSTIDPASGTTRDFNEFQTYNVTSQSGIDFDTHTVIVFKDGDISTFSDERLHGNWTAVTNRPYIRIGQVGGNPAQTDWMILPDGIIAQSCETDDIFQFNPDGSFVIDDQGETWLTPAETGVNNQYNCGDPSQGSPYNQFTSGTYAYTNDGSSITVEGQGAYIMLSDVYNGGNYTEAGDVAVQSSVTYNIYHYEERDGVAYMTLRIQPNDTQVWSIELQHNLLSDNQITYFALPEEEDPAAFNGNIIDIEVAFGTDFTNLVPDIQISAGATISPAIGEAVDASSGSVVYTVTAQNGSTQDWTVNVTEGSQFDDTRYQVEWFKGEKPYIHYGKNIDGFDYGITDFWNGSGNDYYLLRINEYGEIGWASQLLGSRQDGGGWLGFHEIDIDSNGNIFIFGNLSGGTVNINGTDYTETNDEDLVIYKLDSDGNLLDVEVIGGPTSGSIDPYGMIVLNTDEVLISFYLDTDFTYSGVNFLAANTGSAIIKYDNNLSLSAFTPDATFGRFAQSPIDNSIFISSGGSDALLELDPNTLDVLNRYAAPDALVMNGSESHIEFESVGDLIVAATEESSGNNQIFLGKFDPSTEVWEWSDVVGGAGNDRVYEMALTDDDLIYVTGQYQNSWTWDDFSMSSQGGYDIFLTKLGHTGELIWVEQAGSSADDFVTSLFVHPQEDNVVMSGASDGTNFDFLGFTASQFSTWWAKLSLEGPIDIPAFGFIEGFGTANMQSGGSGFWHAGFDDEISNDFTIEGLFFIEEFPSTNEGFNVFLVTNFFQLYFDYDPSGDQRLTMNLRDNVDSDDTGDMWESVSIPSINMNAGQWHHYAVIYSGNIATLVFDGVPVASRHFVWSHPETISDLLIIENQNASVDELRIWNVARSILEIQDNAQTEIDAASGGLVGYWRFNGFTDNGDGTSFTTDETSNLRHLTFNNGDAFINLPLDIPVLSASNITSTSFDVSWDAVSGASDYLVQMALDDTFVATQSDFTTSSTTANFTGSPFTDYFVRVQAFNGAINSPWSDVLQVTTNNFDPGLLAYYPLDGNSFDDSGNGFNLLAYDVNNNPTTISETTGADDTNPGAYDLSNSGDYFAYDPVDGEWDDLNNALTLSGWIYPFSLPTGDPWIDQVFTIRADSGDDLIVVGYDEFGQIIIQWFDGTNLRNFQSTFDLVAVDEWQMISLTIDENDNARVYHNGVDINDYFQFVNPNVVAFDPNGLNIAQRQITRFSVGTNFNPDFERYVDALVDDVRVYNTVLTPSELADVYAELGGVADDTAPTISINAPDEYVRGTGGVTIAAVVTDDISGVGTVQLYGGRLIDQTESGPFAMTDVGNDTYEINIGDDLFDETGLFFRVEAIDNAGNSASSDYETISTQSTGGSETVSFPTGTETADYGMISIPFRNVSVTSAFSELVDYSNKRDQYRLFRFNASNQSLQEFGSSGFASFEPGRGYWFLSQSQGSATIDADLTAVSTGSTVSFPITLQPDWNLIGNPYRSDINWQDVLSQNGDPNVSLLYFWSNGSYSDNNTTLGDFRGAFVNNATGSAITINVPVSSIGARTLDVEQSAPMSLGTPGFSDWRMDLDVIHDKMSSKVSSFGMNVNSTDGIDANEYKPLPHFSEYVELAFESGRMSDWVAMSDRHIWDFNVSSSFVGERTTISWDNSILRESNGYQVLLHDLSSDKLIDMGDEVSYSFVQRSETQPFKIYFAHESEINSILELSQNSIGTPFPNPFTELLKIPVILSEGTGVLTMTMYDVLGRKKWHQVVNLGQSYQELELSYEELRLDSNGTYILKFQLDTESSSKTFNRRVTFFK